MAMKKRNSSLKFVCAIAMSMFSLIALFAGTLAWFTSVRITHNAADDFDVVNTSLMVKSIKVYNQANQDVPYVYKSTPAVIYTVDGQNVTATTTNEAISIRSYSSLSENPDSTILYLFEIDTARANTAADGFSIRAKTDTPNSTGAGANGTSGCLVYKDNNGVAHQLLYDVDAETKANMQTVSETNPHPPGDEYFGKNSMSSVISFAAKGISSFTTDLSSQFASVQSDSFVYDIESDVNGDITYDYSQSLDVFTRELNTQETCPNFVAVVCHYNALSIQYIFNINLGNPVADSEIVNFTCDWYFEIR